MSIRISFTKNWTRKSLDKRNPYRWSVPGQHRSSSIADPAWTDSKIADSKEESSSSDSAPTWTDSKIADLKEESSASDSASPVAEGNGIESSSVKRLLLLSTEIDTDPVQLLERLESGLSMIVVNSASSMVKRVFASSGPIFIATTLPADDMNVAPTTTAKSESLPCLGWIFPRLQ